MRAITLAVGMCLCAAVVVGQTPAAGPLQSDLKASFIGQVERAAGAVDGVVGYVVTDLTTNEQIT